MADKTPHPPAATTATALAGNATATAADAAAAQSAPPPADKPVKGTAHDCAACKANPAGHGFTADCPTKHDHALWAKVHKTPAWLLAGARAQHGWLPHQELTEEEFKAAVEITAHGQIG